MRWLLAAVLGIAGLSVSAAQTPPPHAGDAASEVAVAGVPDFDTRLREAIIADTRRSYEPECGTALVVDRAMLPVEFTGGGPTEYAVPYGVVCVATGGPGPWQGTGGVLVQFWVGGAGGPPRLVLEHAMHGFTVEEDERRLITWQHGAYCPDGAGPDMCRVTYQWNEQDRRFDVLERRLLSELQEEPKMEYGYEALGR